MCFNISRDHLKPLTAEKDIVVYKRGILSEDKTVLTPPFKLDFHYKKGKTYHTRIDLRERKLLTNGIGIKIVTYKNKGERYRSKNGSDLCFLNDGFHCYISEKIAIQHKWEDPECIVEMIIPKGSRYWINNAEIVTETIKWP